MATPDFLDPALAGDEALTSRRVLDGERKLVRQFRNNGHPFAEAGERHVVVHHDRREVDVTYRLDPGPPARMGEVRVEGLKRAREEAVLKRRPWEAGAPFDARLIERFRRDLVKTGMFLTVKVEGAENLDADGVLPVTVEVKERKRRTEP